MKKQVISFLLAIVLIFGMLPTSVCAKAAAPDDSQTGAYGSFVDGNQVIDDMITKNGQNVHPRLIMSNERFADLRSHIGDGSVTAVLLEELRGEANMYLGDSVSNFTDYNGNHLETAKRVQRYVATLAMAYNIFGDEIYAERAYQELEAACSFPDWNPYHFLDPAEMCTGFALGYDWLYNWMNDDQKRLLRTNMIDKGLKQIENDYMGNVQWNNSAVEETDRSYTWYQDTRGGDNWQLVCTGGTNLAALAIGDEDGAREIAAEVITYGYKRAYEFVRHAYNTKDGTYIEGLGYWDYATYYLGLQASALISATGTDYGLASHEGVQKSAEFIRYMSSNTPKSFSFGDDNDSRDTGWPVFLWLGEYLNSPELSAVRLKRIDQDPEFRYLDVLWIDESKQTGFDSDNATDWGSVGASNASFRNTWDESGIVAALHVGENNYAYHGHYDLGSFYIEANGSRFFTDLGNENYYLTNREYSYRIKPEGHNTLVINPSKGTDQLEGANCLVTAFAAGNEAYAISDLTEAYAPNGAKKVERGLKMIKDKECVVIQDEISLDKLGEIYWFAHTKGSINVASDGRSAIVTVGSDRMWVGLMSEGGTFTVMNAEPLSTSLIVSGAASNSEYRKLAVHLTNTKDATISVACIPLKNGVAPAWTPSVKALSEWVSTGNADTGNQGNPDYQGGTGDQNNSGDVNPPAHVHTYDQNIKNSQTLIQAESPARSGKYYKSCQCGAVSPDAYFTVDAQGAANGWSMVNSRWVYGRNNKAVTGWIYDGAWYYLDEDGYMATGWLNDGGTRYYLNPSGAMVTGWKRMGNSWYYFNPSGAMATGWIYDGDWYYLNSTGVMATGWKLLDGTWYYLDASGAMVTGWNYIGGTWYYMSAWGSMATGWRQVGGKWYYLDPDSGAMVTGIQSIGGKRYRFYSNGAWAN